MQTLSEVESSALPMEVAGTSSTSACSWLVTSPDPGDYDDHNMWDSMLGLLCHVRTGVFMDSHLDEAVLEESHFLAILRLSKRIHSSDRCERFFTYVERSDINWL